MTPLRWNEWGGRQAFFRHCPLPGVIPSEPFFRRSEGSGAGRGSWRCPQDPRSTPSGVAVSLSGQALASLVQARGFGMTPLGWHGGGRQAFFRHCPLPGVIPSEPFFRRSEGSGAGRDSWPGAHVSRFGSWKGVVPAQPPSFLTLTWHAILVVPESSRHCVPAGTLGTCAAFAPPDSRGRLSPRELRLPRQARSDTRPTARSRCSGERPLFPASCGAAPPARADVPAVRRCSVPRWRPAECDG